MPSGARAATTRRRFLALGAAGLALVATGIGVVRGGGYDVPPEVAPTLLALSAGQYVLVQQLARRIAAPDVEDPRVPTADAVDVAGFVDRYVAAMRPALRADLLNAFLYVEQIAPFLSGYASRFTALPAEAQDRVLAALEASPIDLLRGAFAGLKSLVFMGYYRDPRTWAVLDYDGPWVNRPLRGWDDERAGRGQP